MVNLTPSNSRLAGGIAGLALLSYLLPWYASSGGIAGSRIGILYHHLVSGVVFSELVPFVFAALEAGILVLSIAVVVAGLIRSRCPRSWAIGLAVIGFIAEAFDLVSLTVYWGLSASFFFQTPGLGLILFYACMIALIVLGMTAKTSVTGRDQAPDHRTGAVQMTQVGTGTNILEKSTMAGIAALALLGTLILPWSAVGSRSRSLFEAIVELFRRGDFGDAPPGVQVFVIAFFITLVLAAIVAFSGLVNKSVGKTLTWATGSLGVILMLVAIVALADMAGGLDRVIQVVGIGYYLFLAFSAWLVWLGLMTPTRQG